MVQPKNNIFGFFVLFGVLICTLSMLSKQGLQTSPFCTYFVFFSALDPSDPGACLTIQ